MNIFNLWLTGLSGSGKTTLALKISEYLKRTNVAHEILDGDKYRSVLSPSAGYTEKERNEFRRKVIFIAKLLNKHNVSCIIPLLSSSREIREFARKELNNFIEIYVRCPLDICVKRDPKGLYKKAKNKKESNIVGIHIPYEEPISPDLSLETDKLSIESCANKVISRIKELSYI